MHSRSHRKQAKVAAIRAKGESETELGAGATGTVVVPPQPVVYQAEGLEGIPGPSWKAWNMGETPYFLNQFFVGQRSTDGFFHQQLYHLIC